MQAHKSDSAGERCNVLPEVVAVASGAAAVRPDHRTLGSFASMLRNQPPVVVASTGGPFLAALVYRLVRRRARLMIWSDRPAPVWRLLSRLAVRLADGVLVTGEPEARAAIALRGTDASVFEIPGPYETAQFLDAAPTRNEPEAYRLVVRSPLSPPSGVLRILDCVARAAERLPAREIELAWIGEGDLEGVLAAQPLPDNLHQRFLGDLGREDTAVCFARSGLLIAPVHEQDEAAFEATVAEAMASGLVTLFDRFHPSAARVLTDGETGVGFDGRQRDGLAQALLSALSSSSGQLDLMRLAARRHALEMSPKGHAERFSHALEIVTRDGAAAAMVSARQVARPSVLEAD